MNEVHLSICAWWLRVSRSASAFLPLAVLALLAGPLRESVAAERQNPYVEVVQEVLDWEVSEPPAESSSPADSVKQEREAILQSDAMLEAIAWLDQYFAVQVDYSPAEVEAFWDRFRRLSPVQLRRFLVKLQQERAQRRAHHGDTQQRRQQALMLSRAAASRSDQAQSHQAADFGRFPSGRPAVSPRRDYQYRPYPPLINSRTVAEWTVYRYIFD